MKPLHITKGRKLKYASYLGRFALALGVFFIMAFIWEGMFAHQEYEWFILIEGIYCLI